MPIPLIAAIASSGFSSIPYGWPILKASITIFILYILKRYFNGAINTSERVMHGKVIMVTGGTSGIGAQVVKDLATRGAQIILLTQHPLSDPFLVDYILDLRTTTNNELITAEHVDLSSLHSIRLFATKWVDNAPPRRLDMIILLANVMTPAGAERSVTEDGVEGMWGVNYLANFHLLSILAPALKVQPADRDVRVLVGVCGSYLGGKLPEIGGEKKKGRSAKERDGRLGTGEMTLTNGEIYATSKLALMTFAMAFEKFLASYNRPDKMPMNARVILVDPGWTRTPGMRRFLTFGSLWGLALYLIMWPFWWLVLKSPDQGAQTFLYAAMEAQYARGNGGVLLKECREVKVLRDEVGDEGVQKGLWEMSEKTIVALEKEGALRRAREKKEKEAKEAKEKREKEAKEKKDEKAKSTATAKAAEVNGSGQRKGKKG